MIIYGNIYRTSGTGSFNFSLNNVYLLANVTNTRSPYYKCISIENRNNTSQVNIALENTTLDCDLRIKSHTPTKLSLLRVNLWGENNDIVLGNSSLLQVWRSEVWNSTFTYGQASYVQWRHSVIAGETNFNAPYNSTRVSMFNCKWDGPVVMETKAGATFINLTLVNATEPVTLNGTDYLSVNIRLSKFANRLVLNSVALNINASFSYFYGHPRDRNAANQLSAGNLLIFADCTVRMRVARNVFYNGTMFLLMNKASGKCKRHEGQLLIDATVQWNQFPIFPREYSFFDILKNPAVPALAFYPFNNILGLDSMIEGVVLNATQNWWGSATGPFLCCLPDGEGAYTTSQVDTSDWCLDPLCTSTSGARIKEECVVHGCAQRLTVGQWSVFYVSFGVGLGALVAAAFVTIWRMWTLNMQNTSRADLVERVARFYYFPLLFSTIAAFATLLNVLPLLKSTYDTPMHAHQERLPVRGWFMLFVWLLAESLQLLSNAAMFLALFLRSSRPEILDLIITPSYWFNIVVVCMNCTLSLWWIPSSGFTDLLDPFFLTHPTPLIWFLYVTASLSIFTSIIALVPMHMLISLLYHYEYARLHFSLDQTLLAALRHDPSLEKQSTRLRQWIAITSVTGIITTILAIYDLVTDRYATVRYILVLVQGTIGLATLVITIIASLTNNVTGFTVVIVLLLLSELGGVQDIVFYSVYLAFGSPNVSRSAMHICFTTIWIISITCCVVLVSRLRESILNLLPAAIAHNLNYHFDRSWNNDPTLRILSLDHVADSIMARPSIAALLKEGIDDDISDTETSPLIQ